MRSNAVLLQHTSLDTYRCYNVLQLPYTRYDWPAEAKKKAAPLYRIVAGISYKLHNKEITPSWDQISSVRIILYFFPCWMLWKHPVCAWNALSHDWLIYMEIEKVIGRNCNCNFVWWNFIDEFFQFAACARAASAQQSPPKSESKFGAAHR